LGTHVTGRYLRKARAQRSMGMQYLKRQRELIEGKEKAGY
jgi:hypothetical protein